jgi:hypothetical protein
MAALPSCRLGVDGRSIEMTLRFASMSLAASFASVIASMAELADYEVRLEIAGPDLTLRLYGQRGQPGALSPEEFRIARAIAEAGKVTGAEV